MSLARALLEDGDPDVALDQLLEYLDEDPQCRRMVADLYGQVNLSTNVEKESGHCSSFELSGLIVSGGEPEMDLGCEAREHIAQCSFCAERLRLLESRVQEIASLFLVNPRKSLEETVGELRKAEGAGNE